MWAIIGGSGFEKFDGFEKVEDLHVTTPFGHASSGICRVMVAGQECIFVSRHGSNHEKLPSEINYRANIYALKKQGCKGVISFSAVGSLRQELKPGDLVVPNQYIDRTKGRREHTFCGEGVVGHVSLAKPVCGSMTEKLNALTESMSFDRHFGKTYVCIEGPQFSTKPESESYRQMGADIIGMTNFPEYALAREAGLAYLPCCFVTDYDCWDDSIPHVTLTEVIEVMRQNNAKAFAVAESVVRANQAELLADCGCPDEGLRKGLFSDLNRLPADKKNWLQVLMS